MNDAERERVLGNVVGHSSTESVNRCCNAPSDTGATSTATSATASRRVSGNEPNHRRGPDRPQTTFGTVNPDILERIVAGSSSLRPARVIKEPG
jgi:hypothetical protein